jgi:hypothetical protein
VLVSSAELDPNIKSGSAVLLGIEPSGVAIVVDAAVEATQGLGAVVIHRLPEHVETLVSDLLFGGPTTHQVRSGEEAATPLLLEAALRATAELLEVERIAWSDVKAVFAAEIVPGFRARLSDALRLRPGQIVDPAVERVDRSTCSLPFLLHWAQGCSAVRSGDVGVLIEAGSGLQVACALYRF